MEQVRVASRREWAALRAINVAVGAWVAVTAGLWPHHSSEKINALIIGVACVLTALAALRSPAARYLNAILGAWLFSSWLILPVARMGTVYIDLVFGLVMFVVALGPDLTATVAPRELPRRSRV